MENKIFKVFLVIPVIYFVIVLNGCGKSNSNTDDYLKNNENKEKYT